METNFSATNEMTARELINMHGQIDFVENPKTNKLFFVCGSIKGYVSQKLADVLDTVDVNDIRYAEIHATIKGVETDVPTLMLASKSNVKRTLR
jgi:hypothetical protein